MSKKKKRADPKAAKAPSAPTPPPALAISLAEVTAIVERTAQGPLSSEERAKLQATVDTLAFLTEELRRQKTSINHLRQMLFGAPTEKTRTVLGEPAPVPAESAGQTPAGEGQASSAPAPAPGAAKPPRPGHGRRAAAAYTGAEQVPVPHPTLHSGADCPGGCGGRVYDAAEPATLVRITGMAPLSACVYHRERLRCNLCGDAFTAPAPDGVGDQKYDETATAMVGLLKYGAGLPFHRIEKLQAGMRIPLPAGTQWELVRDGADALAPVHEELTRQAAQGQVLYNDDTTMRIVDLTRAQRAAAAADDAADTRTGVYTSGIVSTLDQHRVALFCTGAKHAGENLADVLRRRAAELPPPIQMCDALPANTAGDFETIVAHCLAHARRAYVNVAEHFPKEVAYVLDTLRTVYKNDATARQEALTPEQRLSHHQTHSSPLMDGLEKWMQQQFDERNVEPNSGLGQAIRYMQNHWEELTLFLRVAGAPLDNNLCERTLKRAILHRKNALFYKTPNGARVGDLYMSLIHTADINDVPPFDYLVAMLRHARQVAAAPRDWMPWNYQQALARIAAGISAPA